MSSQIEYVLTRERGTWVDWFVRITSVGFLGWEKNLVSNTWGMTSGPDVSAPRKSGSFYWWFFGLG
ncbi:MAG: hypothetical protein UY06_C0038G0009 [Candidatus Amesbacteria bacterium GW2011_GWA2_47_70]|nr:MAG: hypothetical protein UY06_C0038G0009 [Candidatus Amesbacteria bacterium GW2011_GWA2_47_70]